MSKDMPKSAGSEVSNERKPILARCAAGSFTKGFALEHSCTILSTQHSKSYTNDFINVPETSGVFEDNPEDTLVVTKERGEARRHE
jgi:hypothetical protein